MKKYNFILLFFLLCSLKEIYSISPMSQIKYLVDQSVNTLTKKYCEEKIKQAWAENRVVNLKDIYMKDPFIFYRDAELQSFVETYDNIYIVKPELINENIYPFPFILFDKEKGFQVSFSHDGKIYLPESFIKNYHIELIKNLLKYELKHTFHPENALPSMKEKIVRKIYSLFAINDGIRLFGKAKYYADTCHYLVSKHLDYDFLDSTKSVIGPVARISWLKANVILHYINSGWQMVDNDLYSGNLEWFDSIFMSNDDKKYIVHTHQGYFHEGTPFSEVTESLWRLGAGTLFNIKYYIEKSIVELNKNNMFFTIKDYDSIKHKLEESYKLLTDETLSSETKRINCYNILKDIYLLIPDNSKIKENIDMAMKMAKPGWLLNSIKNISSDALKNTLNFSGNAILYIDTRWDQIKKQMDDNPDIVKSLLLRNDPIALGITKAYNEGYDYIWASVQARLDEMSKDTINEKNNIIFKNVSEISVPVDTYSIVTGLNTLIQKNIPDKNAYIDVIEGVLYSRYCGLLLELVAIDYFIGNGYEILYSGIEIEDEEGKYLTELDVVVRNPFTGKVSICEVKSMRSKMGGQRALNTKILYKLESYRLHRDVIEKALGAKIDSAIFIIDTGRQDKLLKFLNKQPKILSKKYGFKVDIINLNMGNYVTKVTGHSSIKSRKKKAFNSLTANLKDETKKQFEKKSNDSTAIDPYVLESTEREALNYDSEIPAPMMSKAMRKFVKHLTSEERNEIIQTIMNFNKTVDKAA